MQEAQKHIYHCNHCGQLFESTLRTQQSSCLHCGKDPLTPPFSSMAGLQTKQTDKADNHGIPGKDAADFFSMNKKRTQKKWGLFFILWLLGLGGLAIIAHLYNKQPSDENQAKQDQLIAQKENNANKLEALKKCFKTFVTFSTAKTTQSKSAQIINGSDLILDLNRYKAEKYLVNDIYRSKIAAANFIETKENTKLVTRMLYVPIVHENLEIKEVTSLSDVSDIEENTDLNEIIDSVEKLGENNSEDDNESDKKINLDQEISENKKTDDNSFEFEVVFWLQDGQWKMDWKHYVRFGEINWFSFIESKTLNSSKRFKIYARPSVTEGSLIDGYTEYKFSEASNNSNSASQLPTSVFIKKNSIQDKQIIEQFDKLEQTKLDEENKSKSTLRNFDPPNSIRIDTTLSHETINEETVLVLKEIHDFDWLTPPSE